MPKEHQVDISMEEQIKVSVEGTTRILDCLERNQVKATFFCTANFALHAPDIIKRIQEGGHEIASHGFYHWTFKVEDLKRSKDQLEEITGTKVYGYRQALPASSLCSMPRAKRTRATSRSSTPKRKTACSPKPTSTPAFGHGSIRIRTARSPIRSSPVT